MENKTKIEFLKHYEPIHTAFSRFCRAIAANPEDAEDLLQDAVLNVLEDFGKIKDLSAFKTYLFSVASNLRKMQLRRNKFKATFNKNEIEQIIDHGQNQEHLADFTIVYEKILSLPKKTAEALILFHISDLSLKEIQEIQGSSLSAIKSRLTRGREKVLHLLNDKKQEKMALIFFTL